ncbi:MAG: NADH-quinone oxidoreductase subunit M [Pseudomonadota bacterium]
MPVLLADFPYLTVSILSPLVALIVIMLLPEEQKKTIKLVGVASAVVSLAVCLYLYWAYDRTVGGIQFAERMDWIPGLGIKYFVGVDGINAPLLLLNGIVYLTGCLTMWELELRVKEYFAWIAALVAGVFGVYASFDLFFFFMFYEIGLLPMYLLIAIWGSTRKEYAAMKLTLYLLAGSTLIFPGLLALYTYSPIKTFDWLILSQQHFTLEQQKLIFGLLYFGFGVLAAIWPFHTWSPVGHVAAPTSTSMLHAGVLMKLGAFGILRIAMQLAPQGLVYWAPTMALLATIGIVYGALAGLAQTDLKYIIGYSSVSHMGVVCLGLSTLTVDGINGAVFQMFAHGIMTALFFSAVGYIYDRTHTREIYDLGGFSKIMPVASAFFIIAALCGLGCPGFASFWAELLVFVAAFQVYPVKGVLAVCALVIATLFALRVIMRTFYVAPNPKFTGPGFADVGLFLASPRIILVGTLIIFGLFPRLMVDVIQTAVEPFVRTLV